MQQLFHLLTPQESKGKGDVDLIENDEIRLSFGYDRQCSRKPRCEQGDIIIGRLSLGENNDIRTESFSRTLIHHPFFCNKKGFSGGFERQIRHFLQNMLLAVGKALHKLHKKDLVPCSQRTNGKPDRRRGFSLPVSGIDLNHQRSALWLTLMRPFSSISMTLTSS